MKFDMHCHTKEGSLDGRISIIDFALLLKQKGCDGMLVTDHNSYGGYEAWKDCADKPKELDGFVVLKGIEYDSRDGGHVLVIMPDGAYAPFLEKRGLPLASLSHLVHEQGGIIGAAHPYGFGYFAIMNTNLAKKDPDIIKIFDFIEAYNSGIPAENNERARILAEKYGKPITSGSDAHSELRVGTAYTVFNEDIWCNDDLIEAIRFRGQTQAVGKFYYKLLKRRKKPVKWLGIISYWIYNKIGAIAYTHSRGEALKKHFSFYEKKDHEEMEKIKKEDQP